MRRALFVFLALLTACGGDDGASDAECRDLEGRIDAALAAPEPTAFEELEQMQADVEDLIAEIEASGCSAT